jgi:hypothetical protein
VSRHEPYADASAEPLDVIRANECESRDGLTAARFKRLFNEMQALESALAKALGQLAPAKRAVAVCELLAATPVADWQNRAAIRETLRQIGEGQR